MTKSVDEGEADNQRKKLFELLEHHIADERILALIHSWIDGLYIPYSVIQYLVDCFANEPASTAPDMVYDAANPELFIPATVVTIFLLVYSVAAEIGKFRKKDLQNQENQDKSDYDGVLNFFKLTYPYLRDMLSALKNGRHAILNSYLLFTTQSYQLIHPIAIACGVLLFPILFYIRRMNEIRKHRHQGNLTLLETIKNNPQIVIDNFDNTQYQDWQRGVNYLCVAINGLTDGSYLYGNAILIALLVGATIPTSGIAWIICLVTVFSIAILSCAAKVIEEYERQREFDIVALQLKIHHLDQKASKNSDQIDKLKEQLKSLIIAERDCFLEIVDGTQRRCISTYAVKGSENEPVYILCHENNQWLLKCNKGGADEDVDQLEKITQITQEKGINDLYPEDIRAIEKAIAVNTKKARYFETYCYYTAHYVARAGLSGVKNCYSAIKSIEYFIQSAVSFSIGLVVSLVSGVVIGFYALYLVLREAIKGRAKESPYANHRVRGLEVSATVNTIATPAMQTT